MPFPTAVRVVDLMVNIPTDEHNSAGYKAVAAMQRDGEAAASPMPAGYMFKNVPGLGSDPTKYAELIVAAMDKHNVEQAMIPLANAAQHPAVKERFRDRFCFQTLVDPNKGMEEIRRIRALKKSEPRLKALSYFPSASAPQVAINEREMYPVYATAIDLDLPIMVNVGVPGPRMPLRCQKVELVDEVCWFYPELKFVMRHGGEPWDELCVKLMLKYPNLYFATSGFAPKYYPKTIIEYANTRGADKVMYAGYFPAGLSLDRIFQELRELPLRDEVWPKFLRENAVRLFALGA